MESLLKMRDHSQQLKALMSNGHYDPCAFGRILDESWQLKRQLASTITNDQIDNWYRIAMESGAVGGKLCGAGAGGFLLFVVPRDRQSSVRQSLCSMKEITVAAEAHGSQVLLVE
jgi:D-glycero-alpha-D-manno-heptose-7-phosphate kinase